MFIAKLLSFLSGTVVILVEGNNLEKFINMSFGRGLLLWDIKRVDEKKMVVSVRLSAIYPLRHIAKATNCSISFSQKRGLPFWWKKILRRKFLFGGAIFCILATFLLSSFVWSVEITGNEKISENEIRQSALQAGIKPWVWVHSFLPLEAEKSIREDFEELSWVGISLDGTKVKIEVVEKIAPEFVDNSPSNIVAKKSGLIEEVLVLTGNPLVNKGEVVLEGQILISGIIPPLEDSLEQKQKEAKGENEEENLEESEEGLDKIVRAEGIVRARVWYEGYGEVYLEEEKIRVIGDYLYQIYCKFGDKEIKLKGIEAIPSGYKLQDREVKKPLQWRNLFVPVEVIIEKYCKLEEFTEVRTVTQAYNLAKEEALKEIRKQMSSTAKILVQEDKRVSVENEDNLVRVKVFAEVLEEIGVEEKFKP